MIRKAVAVILFGASGLALIAWAMSHWSDVTMYRSTSRSCLRLQTSYGRTAALYDGAVVPPGPTQKSYTFAGVKHDVRSAGNWRYVEYSAPSWLVALLLAAHPCTVCLRPVIRARRRRRRGLCVHCGYDLTGNESGVCPECGREVKA